MRQQRTKHARQIATLAILFFFALGVRVFRASQMPVVLPDAIRYIEQAQRLAADTVAAVRDEVYHPLHSAAILAVHSLWPPFHASTDVASQRLGWAHAAQAVGVFCGALMAPLLFLLARRLGARPWASCAAAVAWVVSRRTSAFGVDGYSDMLAICLFTGSMLLALRCAVWQRPLTGRQLSGLFLAGILAGLAYLTRPEGLAAPLIISLAACAAWIGKRYSWRTIGAALLVLWAGVAIPAAPYAVAIGGITHKKQLTASPEQVAELAITGGKPKNPVLWVWLEIAKTLGYLPIAILLFAVVLAPTGWGRRRFRMLMLIWATLWIAIMFWLLLAHGYLNGRHTLILQVLLFPLFGLALQQIETRIFPAVARRIGIWKQPGSPRHVPVVPFCLIAVMVLTAIPGLTGPGWPEMLAQAKAAAWARENLPAQTVIADHQLIVGYYSMHPYARWWRDPGTEADLLREKFASPVILGQFFEHGPANPPDLPHHHPLATFTDGDSTYILYEPNLK